MTNDTSDTAAANVDVHCTLILHSVCLISVTNSSIKEIDLNSNSVSVRVFVLFCLGLTARRHTRAKGAKHWL